jgi:thiamine pyrophosphokinase
MANALLLVKPARARIPARIVGADFDAWIAWDHISIIGKIGETVSLLPITEHCEGIVTAGLRFPLRNETLSLGSPRGVSNELLLKSAQVTFARGLLLVIHLHEGADGIYI